MGVRLLGLLALSLTCWTVPAAGQTRFVWPDTAVNLASYPTVEECLAAVARVAETTSVHEALTTGIWRDTVPVALGEALRPWPATVAATARGCLGRFAAADSVPVKDFSVLVPLYLYAGWEDKARTLVDRRVAAVSPKAKGELAGVLDTVVNIYLGRARWALQGFAPRLAALEEIVAAHLPRVPDRLDRLRVYLNLMHANAADWVMDTAAVRRLGGQAVTVLDSLTGHERAKLEEEYGAIAEGGNLAERWYAALNITMGRRTFLEGLRRSTAEFVKLKRDNWARATGQPPETYGLGMPIGERAPALEGGIWLGRSDSTTPRPTSGRVSLVVFITNPDCLGAVASDRDMYDQCARSLAALRRLERRFPALETTVVAQTHGYFTYLKDSLTPAREAELTKRWLESYGVRAPLVMTATDFWRLPDPDSRRIERDVPNRANYTFGKSWGTTPAGTAFLVDQDGIVVHVREIHQHSEAEFAEMIEILLERGPAQS